MDDNPGLPPDLRLLKAMVMILMGVMIVGVVTIVILFVTRLPGAAVSVPEALQMPDGATALAVTQAPAFWLVTTTENQVLVFNTDGTYRRAIALD